MLKKRKILLLGDSIRLGTGESSGYGKLVAKNMADVAEVYQPNDNCRFTVYTLRYIHEWADAIDGDIDTIYWNNGLWDVVRINQDVPLVGAEDYRRYLKRIYLRLKQLFPAAKIVFALTTPVVEDWQDKNFARFNKDIEEYNDIACKVLTPFGVKIDDLYSFAQSFGKAYRCDAVHFDNTGCEILAEHILRTLNEC